MNDAHRAQHRSRLWPYAPSNAAAAMLGFAMMLIALACSNITLASGRYNGVLLLALACAAAALLCLAVPFVRGPFCWRAVAAVLSLPAAWIVCDFLRRAPYAFGGH
jgi:hypothetical protein